MTLKLFNGDPPNGGFAVERKYMCMDIDFVISWLRSVKLNADKEGKQLEFIMGVEILNQIMNHLTLVNATNYKDIKLYGCKVHVDFVHENIIKICEVKQIVYL